MAATMSLPNLVPTDVTVLQQKAQLAQARMQKHQERTGVPYEPVMVFPQGVFSSPCCEVLKRNGFVAAVNTEISPVEKGVPPTRLRDVWDVAIMAYGSFPIYTRRYAFHGIENFAFDLLLGKPCFIVAHHDFFRDGGAEMAALARQLSKLAPNLAWRSPLQVVRRAYRQRSSDDGLEIVMYASELLIEHGPRAQVTIRKFETDAGTIGAVTCNGRTMEWICDQNVAKVVTTRDELTDSLVAVRYRTASTERALRTSLRYEAAVALRRVLCEARDQYRHRWSAADR